MRVAVLGAGSKRLRAFELAARGFASTWSKKPTAAPGFARAKARSFRFVTERPVATKRARDDSGRIAFAPLLRRGREQERSGPVSSPFTTVHDASLISLDEAVPIWGMRKRQRVHRGTDRRLFRKRCTGADVF